MFIMNLQCLQNALGKVHAVRKLLQTQEELYALVAIPYNNSMKTDFSSCSRTVDKWRTKALKALQMVTVNMTQEARQWWSHIRIFPKVVDYISSVVHLRRSSSLLTSDVRKL